MLISFTAVGIAFVVMSCTLRDGSRESYPNLAVKPSFLQDADTTIVPVRTALKLSLALAFNLSLFSPISMMSQPKTMQPCSDTTNEVVATGLNHEIALNAANPSADWQLAKPVTFCHDWQGRSPAPDRQTEVRVLWSRQTLFLRFECRYRELHVFPDSDPNGRRDQLWDRDVAEAFLQPDPSRPTEYKEFEVSPNGFWIDLDIAPGQKPDLKSGMKRSVVLNEKAHTWVAELEIPIKALTAKFDPGEIWRVNFFRVEGKVEPRGYYSWRPTNTPQPNFHVPSAFGRMRFAAAKP